MIGNFLILNLVWNSEKPTELHNSISKTVGDMNLPWINCATSAWIINRGSFTRVSRQLTRHRTPRKIVRNWFRIKIYLELGLRVSKFDRSFDMVVSMNRSLPADSKTLVIIIVEALSYGCRRKTSSWHVLWCRKQCELAISNRRLKLHQLPVVDKVMGRAD